MRGGKASRPCFDIEVVTITIFTCDATELCLSQEVGVDAAICEVGVNMSLLRTNAMVEGSWLRLMQLSQKTKNP